MNPWSFCYNPTNDKVYCAEWGGLDEVLVIDGATDSLLVTLQSDGGLAAICYCPSNNRVYCANGGNEFWYDSTVTIFDGTTDSLLKTIVVGQGPTALCYNPLNDKIYCANSRGNDLSIVDCGTDSVVKTLAVGHRPCAFVHNPAQNRVYVANYYDRSISVIRDSMPGVGEGARGERRRASSGPTILSGASGLKRLGSSVIYDATGRRVVNPKSGVHFVRAVSGERSAVSYRKVVIAE
jgi:YVTN family beta-propeller protein